jgi:hypothetical protein
LQRYNRENEAEASLFDTAGRMTLGMAGAHNQATLLEQWVNLLIIFSRERSY